MTAGLLSGTINSVLLILFSAFSVMANAQDAITADASYFDNEKEFIELRKRLNEYSVMISNHDYEKMPDILPPAFWKMQIEESGLTEAEYRKKIVDGAKLVMSTMRIDDYEIQLDNIDIKTSSGGRTYLLLPTIMKLTHLKRGIPTTVETETLALMDNNKWYAVSVDKPKRIARFKRAYPDMADINPMVQIVYIDGKRIE